MTEKRHIVWNSDKTEGFITDDYSDACSVYNGEFENPYSSLGYAFHESYGDDEKHFETVDLNTDKTRKPYGYIIEASDPINIKIVAAHSYVSTILMDLKRVESDEKRIREYYKNVEIIPLYRDAPDVPELKTVAWMICKSGGTPFTTAIEENTKHFKDVDELVTKSQAAEIIAAKNAEIDELIKKNNDAFLSYHRALNQCSIEEERAKTAETKLAQVQRELNRKPNTGKF